MGAVAIIAAVKAAVELGVDVAPLIMQLAATFKKDSPPPTDVEWEAMQALEDRLTAELDAPVPEEQP